MIKHLILLKIQKIDGYQPGFHHQDVIDFYFMLLTFHSKYAWVVNLHYKKSTAITNAFAKIFNESKCKPNKIWVDKDSEFYNRPIRLFLQNHDKEM